MKAFLLGLALVLSLPLLTVACGGEEEEAAPTGQISPAQARDLALAFAIEARFSGAEAEGLDWEETSLTPEGAVGSETLQYDADGWRVVVVYPVVAMPTYGVGIDRPETGESWKGRVTSEGEVEETGFIEADGTATLEGRLSAFPEGAQYDDLFLTDDNQRCGIEGATAEVEQAIKDHTKAGDRVRVTGTLATDVPDVEGRQIRVESVEPMVPAGEAAP